MDELNELNARTGGIIRELRMRAGLKQDELGDAVGLSRTSISNIEAGRQKLLLETFYQIAVELKITPSKLLSKIVNQPDALQYAPSEADVQQDDTASYIYDNFINKGA